jgi:hypothetical protein
MKRFRMNKLPRRCITPYCQAAITGSKDSMNLLRQSNGANGVNS